MWDIVWVVLLVLIYLYIVQPFMKGLKEPQAKKDKQPKKTIIKTQLSKHTQDDYVDYEEMT
jgi:type II secretory pathway component PulM